MWIMTCLLSRFLQVLVPQRPQGRHRKTGGLAAVASYENRDGGPGVSA